MEGNGRKLGWIAIGLGVLALLVAVGRGGRTAHRIDIEARGDFGQSAPFAQQAPVAPQGPFAQQAPQAPQAPQVAPRFRENWQFEQRFDQHRRGGPFGFFFLPFMLVGGLIKFIFFALLIWLIVKIVRDRRGHSRPGAGGRWVWQPDQPPADPEKPPYAE